MDTKALARGFAAVLAGAVVWAALWISGTRATQAAFPEIADPALPLEQPGILLFFIGYSVALSLLAGFVTATVAKVRPMTAVWVLAAAQLAMGVAAQVSYWDLMPVWYHLVFLALVVPATVAGGLLRVRRAPPRMMAPA